MVHKLSNLVSLATSMHAQPGVYAVLLGSGVSTGAGIATGWGVVRDIVRRLAAISDPEDEVAARVAWDEPDEWWAAHGEGELGYSVLLERLGPTPAARQGLLAGFFEPDEEERAEGLKQPSKAHHAIADLVKRGYVRVVVTTNFDRLMEQALEAAGVSPQVISRPDAVNGMAPLVHAPATVIKLHGDYKDLGTRNTPLELNDYPEEWTRLLAQVFDEYGLLVAGWSADWDNALVASLEDTPSRRYPLYWDSRSSRGKNAQSLMKNRGGLTVEAASADELFTELLGNVDALERISSPPLSTAMAVARLKRYLPDPVRRLDLHDLVMDSVEEVVAHIRAQVTSGPQATPELLESIYSEHFRSMEQLSALLITGVWHDDGSHDQLWIDVLQRLVDAGTTFLQSFNNVLAPARRLPALIAISVMGMTAIRRDRDSLLIRLANEVEAPVRLGEVEPLPAAQALHLRRLFEDDWINSLPRWNGTRWFYPPSHLMLTELQAYFDEAFLADTDFVAAYHGFEYRMGLIQERTRGYRAIAGEYVGEHGWASDVPKAETAFRRHLARGRSNAWQSYFGNADELETALISQREILLRYRRW